MNLDQFRQAVKLSQIANVPLTLTAAEAEWLLEYIDEILSKDAGKTNEINLLTAESRQLALAHWEEKP